MPSVAERARPADLRDAVESLLKASRTPAKQRAVKVSGVIDVICRHAFEDGLDEDSLRTVVQIVARKTDLDQTSVTTLIKNLYPAQRVPADVVVTTVGALGQGKGKPSPGSQNGLVKWLAIVHEIIDDANVLSRLYSVLFGMLDMISIRTSLCHLLSLITRRKHVKPFRIQQLLELSRGLGNEPALQGLLRIYKDYYPDIILGSASTSRKSFAPLPDPEWRTRILAIQEASTAAHEATLEQQNGFKVLRKGPKRSKVSIIPDVHTYQANEASVTLEGIDNVEDFVEKLDRIEPPGQMISFLTDPLLQKYVELKSTPIISRRIDLWLSTCLEEQYNAAISGIEDAQYLSEILDGLLRHAQNTQGLPSVVLSFLKEYLPVWDGHSNSDLILGLLSFIPIQSFPEAQASYLGPLERALATQNQEAYAKLLVFYHNLLRHWIDIASSSPHSAEPEPALPYPDQQNLHDLVSHVSTLSTSLLLSLAPQDLSNVSVISSILSFYELLSSSTKPYVIPIILPPRHLIYNLLQEPSSTVLSRMCGIIGNYKVAFEHHPKPIRAYYPTEMTDFFNQCMRDIYNLLWVSRALLVVDDKSTGLYCNPALREMLNSYLSSLDHEYAIQIAFGLSNNAWLAALSAASWRAIEEAEIERQGYDRTSINWHTGPVSQRKLEALGRSGGVQVEWERYKVHVVDWLAERGLSGVQQLIFVTAKDLKNNYGPR